MSTKKMLQKTSFYYVYNPIMDAFTCMGTDKSTCIPVALELGFNMQDLKEGSTYRRQSATKDVEDCYGSYVAVNPFAEEQVEVILEGYYRLFTVQEVNRLLDYSRRRKYTAMYEYLKERFSLCFFTDEELKLFVRYCVDQLQ